MARRAEFPPGPVDKKGMPPLPSSLPFLAAALCNWTAVGIMVAICNSDGETCPPELNRSNQIRFPNFISLIRIFDVEISRRPEETG